MFLRNGSPCKKKSNWLAEREMVRSFSGQGTSVHAVRGAGAEEDLALAVHDVLLEVHRDHLGRAEILHRLGDLAPELLRQGEERVDGVAGGENDGGIIEDVDPLGPELPGRERLDQEERAEFEFHSVLLRHSMVGSKNTRGVLRNQDVLDSHTSNLH